MPCHHGELRAILARLRSLAAAGHDVHLPARSYVVGTVIAFVVVGASAAVYLARRRLWRLA